MRPDYHTLTSRACELLAGDNLLPRSPLRPPNAFLNRLAEPREVCTSMARARGQSTLCSSLLGCKAHPISMSRWVTGSTTATRLGYETGEVRVLSRPSFFPIDALSDATAGSPA
nr:unnamed protein product [Spirometra erinaceieuropaei]